MSASNEKLVRELFDEFLAAQDGSGELRVPPIPFSQRFHPDLEFDMSSMGIPDIRPISHGPKEFAEGWELWLSAWGELDYTYELRSRGEVVVALVNQKMHGKGVGIEVDMHYAHVLWFDKGLIRRWKVMRDAEDALEVAGLDG